MGVLRQLIANGGHVHRFVTTPFVGDAGLTAEVSTYWVQHAKHAFDWASTEFGCGKQETMQIAAKVKVTGIIHRQFSQIQRPDESVLYILGHSDPHVPEIGGASAAGPTAGTVWWTAQDLVNWLTNATQPLPRDLLAIKIWSCYSATNGFLRDFRRRIVHAGYANTVCVGYTAATGAMFATPAVKNERSFTKAALSVTGKRVLGRAIDHRVVLNVPPTKPLPVHVPLQPAPAPPPQPVPPPAVALFDASTYEDILRFVDERELNANFLAPRPGGLKKN